MTNELEIKAITNVNTKNYKSLSISAAFAACPVTE